MYQLHTEKQLKYFKEVIRLHYEEGYGEDRIAKILPIGHTTASRWIAIFAREKENSIYIEGMAKKHSKRPEQNQGEELEALKKRVKELEAQLLKAGIKAEFYDEMINVAEAKFKIPIRKKAGAKR